uniref:CD300H molecule/pseudo n=1 Tax=Theropithecus gelada TaxID=9565 RepID=A0A8D2G7C4_THEGE
MTQRAGAALLPSALFLLCVPGCLTVSGPSTVMSTVGESLSVQCQYEEKYKTFNKYWCRQPCLPIWHEMVETRGSEGMVRSDRVVITDHPGDLTFTVTLENLTADDAGKYRCGIATILQEDGLSGFLPDPFFQVQVLVSSASSTENSVKTPGSPTRPSQCEGSLPSCTYFLLLPLLKVPLLLSILGAILWVNRPWRTPWTESMNRRTCHTPCPLEPCPETQPF